MATEGAASVRRIGTSGETVATLVATLAQVHGYSVCDPDPEASLNVQEVCSPDHFKPFGGSPTIAVVFRRLRLREREAFFRAGARRVLDADATLADLAGTVVDTMFDGICQARRYARQHGGCPVQLQPETGEPAIGRLQSLTRRVAEVATDAVVPVGVSVRILLSASGQPVPLVSRVAWRDPDFGLGLELMEPGAPLRDLVRQP